MIGVTDACEALTKRKEAILGMEEGERPDDAIDIGLAGAEEVAQMLMGWDIDLRELVDVVDSVSLTMMLTMLAAGSPQLVIGGTWIDGLATGLMLAELRQKASRVGFEDERK